MKSFRIPQLAAALLLAATTASATTGALDVSFNEFGRAVWAFGFGGGPVRAIALQSDGKVIAVGERYTDGVDADFLVARFEVNGTPDAGFGTGGLAITNSALSSGSAPGDRAFAVAVQADGRILVGGTDGNDAVLVRHLANGALDASFGTGGVVVLAIPPGQSSILSLAVQPDGRILAGGVAHDIVTGHNALSVVRLNASGSLDTTFGCPPPGPCSGKTVTAFGAIDDRFAGMALQGDGRIVVAGSTVTPARTSFAIARLDANGVLDASFGTGGRATIEVGASGDQDSAAAVALRADGRIVVAGTTVASAPSPASRMVVVRLTAAGALDASFGTGGIALVTAAGFSDATAMALLGDGRIVLAGDGVQGAAAGLALVRLSGDGSIDASFGTGGVVIRVDSLVAVALAARSDGRLLAGGLYSGIANEQLVPDKMLFGFEAAGGTDVSFGSSGLVPLQTGTSRDTMVGLALRTDGTLVSANTAAGGESSRGVVVRNRPDGSGDFTGSTYALLPAPARAIAPTADNKVVVGWSESGGFRLTRLDSTNTRDPTFNGGTTVSIAVGPGTGHLLDALAVRPDGRILAAGTASNGVNNDFALARLNADGTPDVTFGSGGKLLTAVGAGNDVATAIALIAGGKILVAGRSEQGANGNDFALVRYSEAGAVEATFVDALLGTTSDVARAIAVQADDRILLAGDSGGDGALIRVNADFTPDTGFATAGVFREPGSAIVSVAVQADGKIVILTEAFRVIRLLANGTPDAAFGPGGSSVALENQFVLATSRTGRTLLVQSDGQIVAGGHAATFSSFPNNDVYVFRIDATDNPHVMRFPDRNNVTLSTIVISDPQRVSGNPYPALLVVGGGSEYCVSSAATCACNVRAFSAFSAMVSADQYVCLRHTSASGSGQAVVTQVSVGPTVSTFRSRTFDAANVRIVFPPEPFGSQPVGTQGPGQEILIFNSGSLATPSLELFVIGGDFVLTGTTCGATLAAGAGCKATVAFQPLQPGGRAGELLAVAAGAFPNEVRVTLLGTGTVSDTTPDPFAFTDQFLVAPGTVVTSAPVLITGLSAAATVTVVGGTWAASSTNSCSGDVQAFTANPGFVTAGRHVCVRHTSSAIAGGANDTQLIIGGLGDTFTSITIDTVPAQFALGSQSDVMPSTFRVSAPTVIQGINTAAPVSASGGEVSIGCNAIYVSAGVVLPGQAICARHLASAGFGSTVSTTVTVGGVASAFTSTTFTAEGDADGDSIPNAVELAEARNPLVKDNDVFTVNRLFAMQQYRDFLNREGDAAGILGWTELIGSGAYTHPQVIDAFVNSPEFGGFVAPVVRLYFATFLRVPDYAGLTFNAGLVRAGTVTLVQLADFFTASPEFAATYGSLTNTQFVTLLYQNVLGRAPDAAGLSGWVGLLQSGYTRGQVLLGFSDSVEYQAAMANEVLVTMMYTAMLRRTPEPSGFSGWLAFLDAGTYTREQVIDGFFLSSEYRARFLP